MTDVRQTNRYGVVGAAALTQAVIIGGMFSYGVFIGELEAEFGWSRTLLSSATSLAFFVMGLLTLVAGRISDRFGPRWVLAASGTICGLGYILLSMIQTPWQLVLVYGLFVGVGLSTHDVVTLSTIAKWFDKKRGLMTSVVKTGTALGQVMAAPLTAFLILTYGWRQALVIIGAVSIVLLLIGAWRTIPNRVRRTSGADELPGLSFADGRRTSTFMKMCLIQLFMFSIVISVPTHLFVHGSDLGLSSGQAATLLSTMGATSIIGRLLVGTLVDRIGSRIAMILAFGSMALSLVALIVTTQPLALYCVIALYGIAHGGYFTVMSPAVAEHFGMRAHGSLFGAILFFSCFGGSLGPLLTGLVFDQFGSYALAFGTMALFATCAFALALTLPRLTLNASGPTQTAV